jgi:hypothetical protein
VRGVTRHPSLITPHEIREKLEALRAAGAGYLLLSFAGSRESLRHFAREIAPDFR